MTEMSCNEDVCNEDVCNEDVCNENTNLDINLDTNLAKLKELIYVNLHFDAISNKKAAAFLYNISIFVLNKLIDEKKINYDIIDKKEDLKLLYVGVYQATEYIAMNLPECYIRPYL